jgi:hypothetical protein
MSSSFLEPSVMRPDAPMMRLTPVRATCGLVLAAAALAVRPAAAAEVFYQPIASLTAETDSNLDLDSGPHKQLEGYLLDAATTIGIATQESMTTLRPRLVYRDYPGDSPDDRLEAYLDINSAYRTQRSTFTLLGSLERQDEFNAEFTSATYNDVNPTQPLAETGRVTNGGTRDSASLFPKYTYSFSPVIGAGVSGQYTIDRYSPSAISDHVDFEYYVGRAFLSWYFSPTSSLSAGVLGSKYEASQFPSSATGTGGNVVLDTTWTPVLSTEFSLIDQHTSISEVLPNVLHTSVNAWGGSAEVVYKSQVSQFKLNANRSVSPSGGGSAYTVNRLQFEYDRSFSTRLSFVGALVGLQVHALTADADGDNRKYAQTQLSAKWMLSRTWFVQGGYQYTFQRYEYDPPSVANNRIYVRFGYQGLGQER